MRLALVFVTVIHGLVHLLGFATAFKLINMNELSNPVTRPEGIFWFQATMLFVITAYGILFKKSWWWMLAVFTVVLSQVLILTQWQDAGYGTLVNVFILVAALIGYAEWKFYRTYLEDVYAALSKAVPDQENRIIDTDLDRLPILIQKYLRYAGVVNTPKLQNVKIFFDGEMRGKGRDWFPFQSEQFNTFDPPYRLFFMRARMKGFNVPGYHAYKEGVAVMTIKLFSLWPIVHNTGKQMDISETVTVFNDMCIMAPAALIDPRILWEEVDSECVKGIFTHKGITISALLYINDVGQLFNFVSDDRYDVSGKTPVKRRWSTPMSNYTNINGFNVPSYGEAIWHYPEGQFVYGSFNLKTIQYNLNQEPSASTA